MRIFASPMFMIFFLLLLTVGGYLLWYLRQINQVRRKTISLIKELEEKYAQVIRQRFTLAVLEDQDMDTVKDTIEEEMLTIIKPNIEAIISHVNAIEVKDVALTYKASTFFGLPRIVEELLMERKMQPNIKLGSAHEEKLYASLRSGMKADIAQRILNWKTGQTSPA
ncbi:MAG: hypothetical protein AAF587_19775 [Bacteroidota bacterium]